MIDFPSRKVVTYHTRCQLSTIHYRRPNWLRCRSEINGREREKEANECMAAGGAVSAAENATAGADACSLNTLPPCSPSSSGLPTVRPQRAVHLSSLSSRPTLASRILRLVDYNFLRKFPLRKRGQTNNKMLANVIPPRYDSTQI